MIRFRFLVSFMFIVFVVNLNLPISHIEAHNASYGYIDGYIEEEEMTLDLKLDYLELGREVRLPVRDFSTTTGLERALRISEEDIKKFLVSVIQVYRDEVPCNPEMQITGVEKMEDHYLANFQLLYECKGDSTRMIYNVFFDDVNPNHINIANFSGPDFSKEHTFFIGDREWKMGNTNRLAQGLAFITFGLKNIFTHYVHVVFLLCLLLFTKKSGEVAEIILAFILGYNITFAFATFDIIQIPELVINILIVVSIVMAVLLNLLKKVRQNRWILAILFGFVHGFGLASTFKSLELPLSSIVSSLLFYNGGIILGQISLVTVSLLVVLLIKKYLTFPYIVRD